MVTDVVTSWLSTFAVTKVMPGEIKFVNVDVVLPLEKYNGTTCRFIPVPMSL